MHCRMFNRMPVALPPPESCNPECLHTLPNVPWGLHHPWLRTAALEQQAQTEGNFFFFFKLIYFWLCWVFVSVPGLSLVVASGGHSSSRCAGLSLSRPLLLRSTGSRRAGSVVVAHGPSCSAACGIFPDQDSNPCPLHWQAESQPLRHQGSPKATFKIAFCLYVDDHLQCTLTVMLTKKK